MNEMLFSKLEINHDVSIEQYNVLTVSYRSALLDTNIMITINITS